MLNKINFKNIKKLLLILITQAAFLLADAQVFINKAEIEYEVNTNIKKTMSNDNWDEMMKENMSDFKIAYYNYTFAENKSIYKFSRWSDKTKIPNWYKEGDEEAIYYSDFNSSKFNIQKQIQGTKFIIEDSVPSIKWKITNESREIAGFNCRKAVGKIFDSVYVFAFYTDDITIAGGPCSISGLPGMILGLSIPRLYTSYIATKVNVSATINTTIIKPPTTKKPYTYKSLKKFVSEKTEEWFSWGDDKEENNRQKSMFWWNTFL
jgi:GLPGLI family protein